ncbi:histidine kinase [Paenarthrobacter nicotinovorans]|uniref:histidine kinase n=1 Tax=Paenarthrobacter nicotinovorans TaxID=29320 RepID=A0ABV0GLU2_PAENI
MHKRVVFENHPTQIKQEHSLDSRQREEIPYIPSPPGIVHRWAEAHPGIIDVLITVIYLAVGGALFALAWLDSIVADVTAALGAIVCLLLTSGSILLRRKIPIIAGMALMAVSTYSMYHGTGAEFLSFPIMLYAIAVYRSIRLSIVFLFAIIIMIAVIPYFQQHEGEFEIDVITSLILITFSLIGILSGIASANRKKYLRLLVERAKHLTIERDQQAQLAVVNERNRIAREMHDIVSHSLTVIATLAEGSLATKDVVTSRQAMKSAADAARTALNEMRAVLGALRQEDDAPLTPRFEPEAIQTLVERFRVAGMPVTLDAIDTSHEDSAIQMAISRIVQEGLTNALRYGENTTVAGVRIYRTLGYIEIEVFNDGAIENAASLGAGQGLLGLRERVSLLGGTLDAGSIGDGFWRVHARLSVEGDPDHEASPNATITPQRREGVGPS